MAGRPASKRPARLAISVTGDLIDAVVRGRLAVGDVLPSEPQLCEEFGVSRVVVREALKALEQKGLVVIRQGQGTVVAAPAQWDPLDRDLLDARIRHDDSLAVLTNLVQVRAALESEMAAAAAALRADQQAAELGSFLNSMAEHTSGPAERYLELDYEFHDKVMQLSGNEIARAIVTSIHQHARASHRYTGGEAGTDLAHAHDGHHAITDAIIAGDPDAAGAAMRSHILDSWHAKVERHSS